MYLVNASKTYIVGIAMETVSMPHLSSHNVVQEIYVYHGNKRSLVALQI
jgi:hypothetical protein